MENRQLSSQIEGLNHRLMQNREQLPEKISQQKIQLEASPQTTPKVDEVKVDRESVKEKLSQIAMKLRLSLPESPRSSSTTSSSQGSQHAQTLVRYQPQAEPKDSVDLRLFVGRLAPECDEVSLRSYFKKFGEIVDVHFPTNASGRRRGFAFVTFSHFFNEHPLDIANHVINHR